jgi:Type II secretion system (T2SS), protein E, N-terminal domain
MAGKKRLGEMLIEAGVIDEVQLRSALAHQRKWGGKLGQALIDLGMSSEAQVVTALATRFGYEVSNVSALRASPALDAALKLVPRELALRQTMLPIAADATTVTVAMGDPSNAPAIDELSFRSGRRVKVTLAGDREIAAAVRRLYLGEEAAPAATALEPAWDAFDAMPDHLKRR